MKTFFLRHTGLVLGAAALAFATAANAGLVGVSFFDGQLIQINPSTGEGGSATALGEVVQPYGLSYKGNRLYTFDAGTDRVREINRFTGALSSGIDVGVGNLTGEGDLAFRPDGLGFLSSALSPEYAVTNDLFRFNLALGTSTRVGTTSVALDGMVFIGHTLYALGQEPDARLYVVNQDTAALTVVGSLGLTVGSTLSALTADSRGQLYAALDDRLFEIDRETGLATAVSEEIQGLGYGGVSGLAFSPVPEPSTYGIAGAALLGFATLIRRYRKRAR